MIISFVKCPIHDSVTAFSKLTPLQTDNETDFSPVQSITEHSEDTIISYYSRIGRESRQSVVKIFEKFRLSDE